jgi:hypothetical protein
MPELPSAMLLKQDVAAGWLLDNGRRYHLAVCSYAMHVLDGSYLFATLQVGAVGYLSFLEVNR